MSICKLEHVEKNYKMGEIVSPLKDVNLTVEPGEFIAISGPSGTGKSTLLYVIGSLLKNDAGLIELDGIDINTLSDTEKTDMRAKKIGFLFQDTNMIQALTIRENLEFTLDVIGKKKDEGQIDELLEHLGLADRADYYPHQLSGGQKRRAMAARALINTPMLILADEPTNDLDDYWAEKLLDLLKDRTRNGSAVIMVTHNDKWLSYADKVYSLADGKLE